MRFWQPFEKKIDRKTVSRTDTGTAKNFIIGYRYYLRKAQTTGTNQNFIICCWCFSCYLFVSLWHCVHMSLSYLSSYDDLLFFCFSFCGALSLFLCLKSKKNKGSDSLPSLMGNCQNFYLHAYLCQNFWVNG